MKLHYVAYLQDDCIIFEGTLEECETVLEHYDGNLAIIGYRDLTPHMLEQLPTLRASARKET